MRRPRALAVIALLAGVLFAGALTSGGAAAADPPTVTLSNGVVRPGSTIVVSGENWPKASQAVITTCGNLSLNLSEDCDLGSQTSAAIASDGKFSSQVTIGRPTSCPCVIRVASSSTSVALTAPLTVRGIPNRTPVLNEQTRSGTVAVKLSGGPSLSSLFGGAATRTAEITVTNTGTVPIALNAVRLTAGKGDNPTERVTLPPQQGELEAGRSAVIKAEVTFPAPAFGTYTVRATVGDLVPEPRATAKTTTYPWLLVLVLWLLLQPLLLGLYRRRVVVDESPDDPFAAGPAPVGGAPGPGAGVEIPVPALAGGAVAVAAAAYASDFPPTGNAVAPRPAGTLVPGYRPVFGVSDLRRHLDPSANGRPQTIAPRIVIGGVLPHLEDPAGSAPPN